MSDPTGCHASSIIQGGSINPFAPWMFATEVLTFPDRTDRLPTCGPRHGFLSIHLLVSLCFKLETVAIMDRREPARLSRVVKEKLRLHPSSRHRCLLLDYSCSAHNIWPNNEVALGGKSRGPWKKRAKRPRSPPPRRRREAARSAGSAWLPRNLPLFQSASPSQGWLRF